MDKVALTLVKTMLNTAKVQRCWPLLTAHLTYLLQTQLFMQRHHQLFNKLLERVTQVIVAVAPAKLDKDLLNFVWAFQVLNKVSALIEMKKVASSTQDAVYAAKILVQGTKQRDELPSQLLQIRAFQLMKNQGQASQLLEKTADKNSIVREFLAALGLYASQSYKMFYVETIGLVAGCKAKVTEANKVLGGEGASQGQTRADYFMMAYAYYLKAFAESTFLAARRQGLTLQEDFADEENAEMYDLSYFTRKAKKSIGKGRMALCRACGSDAYESELGQALDFMHKQI